MHKSNNHLYMHKLLEYITVNHVDKNDYDCLNNHLLYQQVSIEVVP